ncbi:hypothetical protein KCU67_g15157, partial [Aureobasidium melanogenum]
MYHPSRLPPGAPHGQSGRGLFQPRHHPYAASQSRPSQYPSLHYPQATLPALIIFLLPRRFRRLTARTFYVIFRNFKNLKVPATHRNHKTSFTFVTYHRARQSAIHHPSYSKHTAGSAAQQADAQDSYSGVAMYFSSDSDPITEQNAATRARHTTSSAARQLDTLASASNT